MPDAVAWGWVRQGKYVEVFLTTSGKIIGGRITECTWPTRGRAGRVLHGGERGGRDTLEGQEGRAAANRRCLADAAFLDQQSAAMPAGPAPVAAARFHANFLRTA